MKSDRYRETAGMSEREGRGEGERVWKGRLQFVVWLP